MTALKMTKRAKIAGVASTLLAATSLTVLLASHSALASTRGDQPQGNQTTTTAPATSTTTTAAPQPSCTCEETPTPTPTTTTPAPTATPTTPAAPAPVAVTGNLPVTG